MRIPRFVILSALVACSLSLSTFSDTPPPSLRAASGTVLKAGAPPSTPSVQTVDAHTPTQDTTPGQSAIRPMLSSGAFAQALTLPQAAPPAQSPMAASAEKPEQAGIQTAARQLSSRQSSTHLLRMLESDGPEQTALTLTKSRRWSDVRQVLATGQPEAATVLPALMPEADTATALSLRAAMRRALPTHPAAVLSAMDQSDGPLFGARAVCSPRGMPRIWQSKARKAVAHVHEIHLIIRARACLTRLGGLPEAG